MAERAALKKSLGLADVYAISTGAMFSSGFFLLPGIAAIESGSSVSLAYLLAGLMILPAMFSVAELATAMPRAGGAYYFLDRSMGPLMGTVGGLGTWIALVLKSAFALLGMGAYLMIFADVPIKAVAVALTVVFALLNIVGAKETSGLQRALVFALVVIMGFYVAQGVAWVLGNDPAALVGAHTEGFLKHGVDGLFATVGVVFVSYAGLTKVASVAEEVENADRNIPLGMMLSLATATVVYVLGVAIMTLVLDADAFHTSYTPVADAGRVIFTWIPKDVGLWLVVIASTAAFASTGNAGVLSSSRYPMAMARDRLLPEAFARLSPRFGTPVLGVVTTAGLMIILIVAFDISAVAKLASAFQLMLFGLLSLALIVMRESRIDYYQPGYRSPLYPWMQIAGMIVPIWLIVEMGWLAILFTAGVIACCIAWYFVYARARVDRGGAVFHVFERLGRRVYRGLDDELRGIVADKGLDEADPVEHLVFDARVLDLDGPQTYGSALDAVCARLADDQPDGVPALRELLADQVQLGLPVLDCLALPHARVAGRTRSRLVLLRALDGITIINPRDRTERTVLGLAVLVGPESDLGLHLRLLAHFGRRVNDVDFGGAWTEARTPTEIKEVLLREDRFHHVRVREGTPAGALIGKRLAQANLPSGVVIALMQRTDGAVFVPRADSEVRVGDRLTAIGDGDAVAAFRAAFDPEFAELLAREGAESEAG